MTTRGFTFIEMLIVIGLVAFIMGVGVVMSYGSIARVNIIQERDLLVSLLLSGARARAMANIDETSHGVHIDNTAMPHKTYTLFEGDAYTDDPSTYRVVNFANDADRVSNTDNDNVLDIIFKQRSGNVAITGGTETISLSGNGKMVEFEINEAGRIDW